MGRTKKTNPPYKLRFAGEWDEDYYIVDVTCENCTNRARLMILKGLRKPRKVDIECTHCGCKAYRI